MNKKIYLTLLAVLAVGVLILSGCNLMVPQDVDATNEQTNRTLSVTGKGTVTLVPDIAYINIGVHSQAEDVSTAVNSNNEMALGIRNALLAMNVEEKDVQTANFNVYSMQQYDFNGQPSTVEYAVDNTLYVTVRDLSRLSDILDAALSAGANQIYGISFDISDRQAALDQARDLAIQDAEAKALATAATAKVELGEVLNINVSSNSFVQPYGYGASGLGGGAYDSAASVPVSAGQIVITFDANLTYQIH